MVKVVFKENLVSEIGRACLIELECKSRWWSRCRHICSKFGLLELVNLINIYYIIVLTTATQYYTTSLRTVF